jgi:hypothetical protein
MTVHNNPIRRVLLVLTVGNRRVIDMQGTLLKPLRAGKEKP